VFAKFMRWLKSDKCIVVPLLITNYVYESKGGKRRFAFGYKQSPILTCSNNNK